MRVIWPVELVGFGDVVVADAVEVVEDGDVFAGEGDGAAVRGLPRGSDDRLVTVHTVNLIAQRDILIALCKGK